MNSKAEKIKCLIIGSGPAGCTAGIYLARAGLKPVIFEGTEPGGQLTTTDKIENFPGFPEGIRGSELMERMKQQAIRFGAEIRNGTITSVEFEIQPPHIIIIDNEKEILAETVVIASGASAKYLGLESEQKYIGKGVSVCATCDGFFYKGKNVAVVGGGDAASEEATYLANIAKKVYLIVRKDYLRASKTMQDRVFTTPNIEIMFNYEVKEVLGGDNGVTGILIFNNKTNKEIVLPIDGLFVAIGHKPNTDIFRGQIDMDKDGYIVTRANSSATSIEGVFAAGDVQDHVFRQAITAAASGCMASIEVERYLKSKIYKS